MLKRIQNRAWALVFGPSGLAAIASSRYQYTPLFPLTGVQNLRSVFVVREDSLIQTVSAISGKLRSDKLAQLQDTIYLSSTCMD
ncbi:MAG: hypothetical protein KME13_27260 [Myxacorys californica WJT36-NPBG1]|nr:hypothetical protein [Myxacorys californica WJT36-NPBG1]